LAIFNASATLPDWFSSIAAAVAVLSASAFALTATAPIASVSRAVCQYIV
jgi:hypothetical protein